MTASHQQVIRSYRNLYRHGLHAVQYASPARYTVKALIENAYRTGKLADFDNQKVNNTLTFLHGAAKEKGLEHRILKNLLHTWWWENRNKRHLKVHSIKIAQKKHQMSKSTIDHFEITLKMLNESMGMCLPTRLIMVDELPEDDAWLQNGSDSEELSEHPLENHKPGQQEAFQS